MWRTHRTGMKTAWGTSAREMFPVSFTSHLTRQKLILYQGNYGWETVMWSCNVRLLLAAQSSRNKESTLSSVRASVRCDVQGRDRWKENRKSRVEDTITLVPSGASGENRSKSVAYELWPLVEDVVMPQPSLMRATPFPPTSDLLVLSLAQSNRMTENKGVWWCWLETDSQSKGRQGHTELVAMIISI